jgi:hypothetical protein
VEPSPTPTPDPCAGFAQHVVHSYGVQDDFKSLCQPDGEVAEIGLESNSELVLDMNAGNEIVDDTGIDFYFYEWPNGPGIYLDRTEIAVASDGGSGQPEDFVIVFVWGDGDSSNNGTVLPKYLPEIPNRWIPASDLRNGSGIGIDIEQDDGRRYRFVRIRTYPPSATPHSDKRAQVDAIERVSDMGGLMYQEGHELVYYQFWEPHKGPGQTAEVLMDLVQVDIAQAASIGEPDFATWHAILICGKAKRAKTDGAG